MPYSPSKFFPAISLKDIKIHSCLWELATVVLLGIAAIAINWKMITEGLILSSFDVWHHTTWLQHFSKQLAEGIWYPRWLAGTNFGYGSATFVFYPPLVYYLGSFLKMSGLNTEQTIIALFVLATWGMGLSFYIYSHQRGRLVSLIGALIYMTAPYIAYNIYTRGALAETWALVWIPLGFWLTEQAIVRPKFRILLTIFSALFALTHLPSLLIFTIVWTFYLIYLCQKNPFKAVVATFFSAIIGWGLVSFYLLPAILEQSFVNMQIMTDVSGGFSANVIGSQSPHKSMAIINKYYFYGLALIIIQSALALFYYQKDQIKINLMIKWTAFLLFLAFFMSYLSSPIWQMSKILQMIQFPWRLLGIFSFGTAVLSTLLISELNQKKRQKILIIIVSFILLINIRYIYTYTKDLATINNPKGKFTTTEIKRFEQILYDPYTDKLIDYIAFRPLLKNGKILPPLIGQPRVSVITGQATIYLNQWSSYQRIINLTVEEASIIKIRTFYYPAWHLYVNDKSYPIDVLEDGTIGIKLAPGSYVVSLLYQWTPAFTIGTVLSCLSLTVWLGMIIFILKS
jgi:hypothetical protein